MPLGRTRFIKTNNNLFKKPIAPSRGYMSEFLVLNEDGL